MIKKDKGNVVDVPPVEITDGLLNMVAMQGNNELRSATRNLQNHVNAIEGSQRDITNYRSNIRRNYENITERGENIVTLTRDKKKIEKEIEDMDNTEATAKVVENLDMVRRLKYVESIEVSDDAVVVNTRLIFTDIRKESGSREYTRRCIGAFKITFYLAQKATRIQNMLFPNIRHHWAVGSERRGVPCQGEHEERFEDAYNKNDLFMLLETVYHFLLSTDDNGAYLSSDEWIENRNRQYGVVNVPSLRKDNYVFVHTDYEQYSAERDCNYAKIVRCDHGNIYLQFAEPFDYGHDMRGLAPEGTGYRVPSMNVKKISKAEYDAKELTLETVRNDKPLDALDLLPDGSTLSDANELF